MSDGPNNGTFEMKVLGRLLEHLGVQMYKRRDVAIAELVANAWDAGAEKVEIVVPEVDAYDPGTSVVEIRDSGSGIEHGSIESDYLVVGRDRRKDGQPELGGRKPMGRKGIGKLAGFGIARRMTVRTWRGDACTEFTLDAAELTTTAKDVKDVQIPWTRAEPLTGWAPSGTHVCLATLKHKTALDIERLRQALARRFGQSVKGHMAIFVNNVKVGEPDVDLEHRVPETGTTTEDVEWQGGTVQVRYWYGFSKKVLHRRDLRGFTIHVRGRTAQAPPFSSKSRRRPRVNMGPGT